MTSQARKEYQRDWERAHAAGRGRSRKEWLAANPDKAAAYNARTRAWTAENTGRAKRNIRTWKLRTQYGLSSDEYGRLLEEQTWRCAICGKDLRNTRREPSVDHDHLTGRVRGILCDYCNQYLVPAIEKNRHLLDKVLAYLG